MKLTPERLRECRSEFGITQGDLARIVGVSSSFLSAIERDERHLTPSLESRILAAFQARGAEMREFLASYDRVNKIAGGE